MSHFSLDPKPLARGLALKGQETIVIIQHKQHLNPCWIVAKEFNYIKVHAKVEMEITFHKCYCIISRNYPMNFFLICTESQNSCSGKRKGVMTQCDLLAMPPGTGRGIPKRLEMPLFLHQRNKALKKRKTGIPVVLWEENVLLLFSVKDTIHTYTYLKRKVSFLGYAPLKCSIKQGSQSFLQD